MNRGFLLLAFNQDLPTTCGDAALHSGGNYTIPHGGARPGGVGRQLARRSTASAWMAYFHAVPHQNRGG